jgi:hypothetical protein
MLKLGRIARAMAHSMRKIEPISTTSCAFRLAQPLPRASQYTVGGCTETKAAVICDDLCSRGSYEDALNTIEFLSVRRIE